MCGYEHGASGAGGKTVAFRTVRVTYFDTDTPEKLKSKRTGEGVEHIRLVREGKAKLKLEKWLCAGQNLSDHEGVYIHVFCLSASALVCKT